jgi:flap endonuclease GEN
MTVASLWKALDRAGCGKRVGAKELQDLHGMTTKTNPWNVREMEKASRSPENRPILAVDLSIWICEALTSSAMKQNHVADPPLQLVYSRALKLLTFGIKLVVVIEGKRRNRVRKSNGKNDSNDTGTTNVIGADKFRKRRSGTMFWTACERCETMLKLLGVIVVRAKAEGEALCALLNQRGIVDGVISNDGDCLLFGAKVLYTKFSVENLDHSNVIRYDANDIRVVVDDDDANKYDETGVKLKNGQDIVEMSRNDLIAFAILTGSDLAGDGLSKVGCRKAIRFIRKCQIDNPLKLNGDSSPAIDQLLSWEQTATSSSIGNIVEENTSGPHCGCCGHPGTKRDHKKFGCKSCGTGPGEPCIHLSPGGRFRKLLRSKALKMQSSFDPSSTLKAYNEPNENQVPFCLVGKTARTLNMNSPQLDKFLQLPFVIRGRSLHESREFVRKSLSAYLARQEVFSLMSESTKEEQQLTKLPKNHNRPSPMRVNKLLLRNGRPSCEVKWVIKATTSDAEGNPMDQYEFSTIEDEFAIKKCYPKLFHTFQEEKKRIEQQGTAEQEKRRSFLLSMEKRNDQGVEIALDGAKKSQTRKDYFEQAECIHKPPSNIKGVSDDVKAILIQIAKKKGKQKDEKEKKRTDVHIGRVISTETDIFTKKCPKQHIYQNDDEKALIGEIWDHELRNDDCSTIGTVDLLGYDISGKNTDSPNPQEDYFRGALAPGHIYYLGIESVFQFRHMAEVDSHLQMKHKSVVSGELNKENLDTIWLAERKGHSGKDNLGSKSLQVFPLIGNNGNKTSHSHCKRLEQFQDGSYGKKSGNQKVVEVCSPVEVQPNLASVLRQRSLSRNPLPVDEVVEQNSRKIDICFHDDRVDFMGDNSRGRFFISNHKPLEQMYDVRENTKNFHSDLLYQRNHTKSGSSEFGFHTFNFVNDQRNERIEAADSRNSVRVNLQSSRRFEIDQCHVEGYHLQGKGEYMDQLQFNVHDFDPDSYDKNEHIRGRKQRKRRLYETPQFYGRCPRNQHDQSEIDATIDYSATSYCLHPYRGGDICSKFRNGNAYKETRNSRTQMLQDQSKTAREREQRGVKKRKNTHHSGIPNHVEDELYYHNECCWYSKKDELNLGEDFITQPTSFDMLRPLDPAYAFEDRSHVKGPYYSELFDERDDRQQDDFRDTEILNHEIGREANGSREQQAQQDFVCGSAWCSLGEWDDHQDQSTCMDSTRRNSSSLNPTNLFDAQVVSIGTRDELEERVARKVESRTRRAQIGLLCSKYI